MAVLIKYRFISVSSEEIPRLPACPLSEIRQRRNYNQSNYPGNIMISIKRGASFKSLIQVLTNIPSGDFSYVKLVDARRKT